MRVDEYVETSLRKYRIRLKGGQYYPEYKNCLGFWCHLTWGADSMSDFKISYPDLGAARLGVKEWIERDRKHRTPERIFKFP